MIQIIQIFKGVLLFLFTVDSLVDDDDVYSILSLVQTPGDHFNLFALSDIPTYRCHSVLKGIDGDRSSVRINRNFVLSVFY